MGTVTRDGLRKLFIRDRNQIERVILPIFDKYPLLTSKYFDYARLRKAFDVLQNSSLSREDRDAQMSNLKHLEKPDNYLSPA